MVEKPSSEALLPETGDPYEFISKFRDSDEYSQAYESFYLGKALSSDVSESEKRSAFEADAVAADAMLRFSQHTFGLHYDPSGYPQEVSDQLSVYFSSIEDSLKGLREGWNIEWLDSVRSQEHNASATALVTHGIVPSVKLGRTLCRILAISKNLDTYEKAKRSDIERIRRKMGL